MLIKARLWLAVLACTGSLVGAGGASAVSRGERVVTASANGKTVRLARTAVLRIDLAENPGTGYAWRITSRPAAGTLRLLSDHFVADSHPAGVVGAGGTRMWRYRGGRPGRTSVVIKLFPPGTATKPAQAFRLTVVVVGHRK